jgi:hypothetical protein
MTLNNEQIMLLKGIKGAIEAAIIMEEFDTEHLNPTSPLSNVFEAIGKELIVYDNSIIHYESNN